VECSYAHTFSEKHIYTRGTHYHSHTSFKDDQFALAPSVTESCHWGLKTTIVVMTVGKFIFLPYGITISCILGKYVPLWQRSGTSAPTPTMHHSHWTHHRTSGRADYHSQTPQLSLHIEKLQHYKNCTISLLSSALRLTPQTCFY
jgi:hypothetical protein